MFVFSWLFVCVLKTGVVHMFKNLVILLNDYLFGMALCVCNIYLSNQVCH